MRKRLTASLAAAIALVLLGVASVVAIGSPTQDQKEKDVKQAMKSNPKNVIFFLGDGMGTQEITAARYYQGVHNSLNVDRMPLTGFDTTPGR
jgi:alkaline phosphatase/streptomycin-6-phosphatase